MFKHTRPNPLGPTAHAIYGLNFGPLTHSYDIYFRERCSPRHPWTAQSASIYPLLHPRSVDLAPPLAVVGGRKRGTFRVSPPLFFPVLICPLARMNYYSCYFCSFALTSLLNLDSFQFLHNTVDKSISST